jgi:ABC-type spermidine/putrescine transport system permease subunit II
VSTGRFRPSLGGALLWGFTAMVLGFLLFPLIAVFPISLSEGTILEFPPESLSLRWYEDFFGDRTWTDALFLSLRLGAGVALLATVLGLATAVAITRYMQRGRGAMRALVLAPLMVPVIVTAIAVYDIAIDLRLVGTFWGLLLAHTVLALPFAVIILESALKSVDRNLEDAAVSLGANRVQAFVKVTVPILRPAILTAMLLAFVTSWDEVVVVLFVGGAFEQTLPVRMFEFLTTQVRPTVAAASGVLIASIGIAAVAAAIVRLIRRRRDLRRIGPDPVASTPGQGGAAVGVLDDRSIDR